MKRGVSPVVATVLLIAITVVLAAIIFLWAQSFLREGAQKNDRAVELSCDDIVFSAELYDDTGGRKLGISNSGNVPIFGFEFRGVSYGSIIPEVVQDDNGNSKLSPGESGIFPIDGDYQSGLVVPVLLAEASDGNRVTYPCPDSTGKNVQLL